MGMSGALNSFSKKMSIESALLDPSTVLDLLVGPKQNVHIIKVQCATPKWRMSCKHCGPLVPSPLLNTSLESCLHQCLG